MEIFVTGIAGFIGFHAALALKKRGFSISGCDNFNTYYSPKLKRARAALLKENGIEVFDFDLCDADRLKNVFIKNPPSHVLHLAAQAGVRYARENPLSYVRNNLEGFVHLLEACVLVKGVKLVYASSSSVYGLNTKTPFSEKDPVDSPASLYAATKRGGEMMAHSYHHLYQIPMIGLRFFTVYGPWGRPDMAYYTFTEALFKETPIPIFGDGSMQRDFTYIGDIVAGIESALEFDGNFEIFNLGGSHPYSVLELVSTLEELTGKKAQIDWKETPKGEVESTCADLSKSHALLGYSPQTSLKEGLAQFVSWYESYSFARASLMSQPTKCKF